MSCPVGKALTGLCFPQMLSGNMNWTLAPPPGLRIMIQNGRILIATTSVTVTVGPRTAVAGGRRSILPFFSRPPPSLLAPPLHTHPATLCAELFSLIGELMRRMSSTAH
ncbi:hypothetical protein AOLI_G00329170 [Acnodon oligacanthus]